MRVADAAVGAIAATALFTSAGQAQALGCTTTSGEVCDASGCRQSRITEVRQYPAEAHFQMIVRAQATSQAPALLQASDPLLEANAGFDASRWNTSFQSTPTTLPISLDHGFAYQAANLTISSYDACRTLAGAPAASGPVFLDNRLTVSWEGGQAQCTSRVVCFP